MIVVMKFVRNEEMIVVMKCVRNEEKGHPYAAFKWRPLSTKFFPLIYTCRKYLTDDEFSIFISRCVIKNLL